MNTTFDTDEGVKLDIWAKQKRTFDLEVNLQRALTGHTYKMAVVDASGTSILEFSQSSGITIDGTKIILNKSYTAMDVRTGVYSYDLIELTDNAVNNVMYGNFIIEPSVTSV